MLQRLGSQANDAIEEVYEDLSELGSKIRYLPSSDRNALAKQVEELYDICRMSGVHARHSSECIHGLNLSIMSPWVSAFRDERGIEKAIDIIKQSRYSGNEAVSLLNEAARWGITSAAERDPKKRAFLEAVSQIQEDCMLEFEKTLRDKGFSVGPPVGSAYNLLATVEVTGDFLDSRRTMVTYEDEALALVEEPFSDCSAAIYDMDTGLFCHVEYDV